MKKVELPAARQTMKEQLSTLLSKPFSDFSPEEAGLALNCLQSYRDEICERQDFQASADVFAPCRTAGAVIDDRSPSGLHQSGNLEILLIELLSKLASEKYPPETFIELVRRSGLTTKEGMIPPQKAEISAFMSVCVASAQRELEIAIFIVNDPVCGAFYRAEYSRQKKLLADQVEDCTRKVMQVLANNRSKK